MYFLQKIKLFYQKQYYVQGQPLGIDTKQSKNLAWPDDWINLPKTDAQWFPE